MKNPVEGFADDEFEFIESDRDVATTSAALERVMPLPATTTSADALILGAIALHHRRQKVKVLTTAVLLLVVAVIAVLLRPSLVGRGASIEGTKPTPTVTAPIFFPGSDPRVETTQPIEAMNYIGDASAYAAAGIGESIDGLRADSVKITWFDCVTTIGCPGEFRLTLTNTSTQTIRKVVGVTLFVDGAARYGRGTGITLPAGQTVVVPINLTSLIRDDSSGFLPESNFGWNWFLAEMN